MLKELRLEKELTQEKAAEILGVSRKTLIRYEKDESRLPEKKLNYYCRLLQEHCLIDESHGVLTLDRIKKICQDVLKEYAVEYGYLFGSYAKGKATETSDVDLLISSSETGLRFYDMVEVLRESLNKKVDVLEVGQLSGNMQLPKEILKDGIKVYG